MQSGRRLKLLDIIRPLLGIHELEHVSLNARVPAMWALWTIEDIHDIAVAWPNLQELRLNYVIHAATIPISALSSFAQFSPRLQFLYMESIDFSLAPPSVYGSDAGNNHGLKQLWLPGDVASADLALLALYLDSLFPDLRSSSSQVLYLETGWRHPITYDNGWQKLMAVLSAVQTARYARSKGVSRCQRPLLPDISSAGHSKSNEDDVNILGRRRWLCFM
ncbi:hypothetical protein A0H81_10996 [Grifola frondosa]|uniref:F-box domain-containing protein n=1 Tax=Grifola frondosa TaxID=5627 RepID=A0A1C7LX98_GRIFR|nr:hypothetical protein A0H81_10996 [Grifola frondosa]